MKAFIAFQHRNTKPDALTRRIIYVRHGLQEWNLSMLVQGEIDAPLTTKAEMKDDTIIKPSGVEQAKRAGEILRQHLGNRPVAIFTSDMKRAQQTAQLIRERLNVPNDKYIIVPTSKTVTHPGELQVVKIQSGLREIYFGNYARVREKFGIKTIEYKTTQDNGGKSTKMVERWEMDPAKYHLVPKQGTLPDSETEEQLEIRVIKAIQDISTDPNIPVEMPIIVVAHEYVYRSLVRALTGIVVHDGDLAHCGVREFIPGSDSSSQQHRINEIDFLQKTNEVKVTSWAPKSQPSAAANQIQQAWRAQRNKYSSVL